MKKYLLIILSFFIFLFNTCSTKYMYPELSDFSDATDLIGKNIIYIFEKFQEEEMNLRVAQLVEKNSIKPEDLEPKVLTFQHLETRKSLIKYLVKYTRLLVTVFKKDYRKEIIENSKDVKSSLEEISENHKNFLSKKEIGIISTIAAAIPEALTYSKKRKVVKKIMRQNQILLEKIIGKLEGEMNSLQKVIQNFYDRQFILMVKKKMA